MRWYDREENASGALASRLSTDTAAIRGALGDQVCPDITTTAHNSPNCHVACRALFQCLWAGWAVWVQSLNPFSWVQTQHACNCEKRVEEQMLCPERRLQTSQCRREELSFKNEVLKLHVAVVH